MIQVYEPGNTNYEQNGDKTLFPESAIVHAVLNGEWEISLSHPIDPEDRWKYIMEDAVVKMPSFNGEQLFRIKKKEKKDSAVEAELQPIFMDAKDDCFLLDVRPDNKTGQEALDMMMASNGKYTGLSDIEKRATSSYQTVNLVEAINGNEENSFINCWGGEILFDNFSVIINQRIGNDHGVEIRYGKNLQEDGFSEEVDMRDIVTRLVPKAYNGYMIDGKEPWVDSPNIEKYPTVRYGKMDFEDVKMREDAKEDDAENGIIVCDTQEALETALKEKCREQFNSGLDKPKVTISADVAMLDGTDLYQDIQDLESVSLGDTVHCRHTKFDITTEARCIELEWDCVGKRIKSVVIGDFQFNYMNEVNSTVNRVEAAIREDGSVIAKQVQGIINGVKAQLRAQSSVAQKSKVRATLFEDLDPESPTFGAMCLGTMGFEIASQRTADGRDWDWKTFGTGAGFYADFIVAGTMLANRIRGGTLELGGWNNDDGILKLLDEKGTEILRLSNGGMTFYFDDKPQITIRCFDFGNGGKMFISPGDSPSDTYFSQDKEWAELQYKKIRLTAADYMQIICNGTTRVGNAQKAWDAKTGTAQFSDGTYLEFVNGFLVGGNTKEGAF